MDVLEGTVKDDGRRVLTSKRERKVERDARQVRGCRVDPECCRPNVEPHTLHLSVVVVGAALDCPVDADEHVPEVRYQDDI